MRRLSKSDSDMGTYMRITIMLKKYAFAILLVTYFIRFCKCSCQCVPDVEFNNFTFPQNFLFGAGTSAYQSEGAWNVDGKGMNIFDKFTHEHPEDTIDFTNADDACKSYYKYKEDVQNLKDLCFQVYRFSIAWTRILPDGTTNNINQKGVEFYHRLLDELLKEGIQPMVAIFHFDLPQALQEYGGWTNRSTVDHFVAYSDLLFRLYGHKVKFWIPIVEPVVVTSGYVEATFAPGIFGPDVLQYLVMHHLILAHASTYRLYINKYKSKQKGLIGTSTPVVYCYPLSKTVTDNDAARRFLRFHLEWFTHPIFSKQGDYPRIMREHVDRNSELEGCETSRLPRFTKEEIEFVRGTFDFFGFNYYTSVRCTEGQDLRGHSWSRDGNVTDFLLPSSSAPRTSAYWQNVDPVGFYLSLQYVKQQYDNPLIFITENGYAGTTGFEDDLKINFAKDHLTALLKAMKEGSRVMGYIWWSLMDVFEVHSGYRARFGLIEVNFTDPNKTRTKRKSANFFKRLIEHNNCFK